MTRTMYDSITATNIPVSAELVAGYVDGRYRWSDADWARFPHAVKVRIAVFPSTNDGHVLDVEAGDSTPEQAPGWVTRRRAAGVDPTVYTSESWWPRVRAQFAAQHVAEPHWWIAGYPGIAVKGAALYPGSVAHQWRDTGPYDLSVVADHWPGIDPAPSPAPVPTEEDDDMTPEQEAMVKANFIDTLYDVYAGRSPDPGGFEYWLTKLNASNTVAVIAEFKHEIAAEKAKAAAKKPAKAK